jgi:hypothetical protein
MTNARTYLSETLAPLLPRGWQIVPYADNVDTLSRPVVMLQQKRITPSANTPMGRHSVEFSVILLSPSTDVRKAEDDLDEQVDLLLYALEDLPTLVWTNAERAVFDGVHGWDITLTLDTLRKN